MDRKFLKTFICLTVLVLHSGSKVWAAYDSSSFDDKSSYDIYFYTGYGSSSVIKNVKILGIKEIAGKKFIFIKPYGFKLDEAPGYVAIDSLTAILSNQQYRLDINRDPNIRF